MQTELTTTKIELINEFIDQFGDDLDACHPDAFDLLDKALKNPVEVDHVLKEFEETFLEEMEGCFYDAFEFYSEKLMNLGA